MLLTVPAAAPAGIPYTKAKGWMTKLRPHAWPLGTGGAAVSPEGTILYLTVPSQNLVYAYSTDGTYLFSFGSYEAPPGGQLENPRGIATDAFGDVYVADTGHGRVQKYRSDGRWVTSWDSPGVTHVASDGVYVLALMPGLNIVSRRSRDGADLGAFVARMDSFEGFGYYDPPSIRSTALAVDRGEHPLVAADFSQGRNGKARNCVKSAITGKGPAELPDPLVGPGLGRYDRAGALLGQSHAGQLGGICWHTPVFGESYGSSSAHASGTALAADPSGTGAALAPPARSSAGQPFFVHWMSFAGDKPYRDGELGVPKDNGDLDDRSAYTGSGAIRALAIDCRSQLYMLTDWWLFRFRHRSPPPDVCGRLDDVVALGWPVLGATGRSGVARNVAIAVACPPAGGGCSGVATVTLRPAQPCADCRRRLQRKFKIGPGKTRVLRIALGAKLRAALARGGTAQAGAAPSGRGRRALRGPAVRLRMQPPLTLRCGAGRGQSVQVSGTSLPGVSIRLAGPGGAPVALRAGRDGRFRGAVPSPSAGERIVAATGPTRSFAPVAASCTRRGGPVEAPLIAAVPGAESGPPGGVLPDPPVPPPPGLPASTLTLACERRPADLGLAASGTLTPAVAGSIVKLVFTPGDAALGPPVSVDAATDAAGAFEASKAPPAPGPWTVTAAFAGDAGRAPSAGTPCPIGP